MPASPSGGTVLKSIATFRHLLDDRSAFDNSSTPARAGGDDDLRPFQDGGRLDRRRVYDSMRFTTTGSYNTAVGVQALDQNNSPYNCALGYQALYSSTTGGYNVASGFQALYKNTDGYLNVASGYLALYGNTTGYYNTSTGAQSLQYNSTGFNNTANGVIALGYNHTGHDNIATGYYALANSNTGSFNSATGASALGLNSDGNNNTATGYQALYNNSGGDNNTAEGSGSLYALTTGNNNVAVGSNAGNKLTTGSNNIVIGANVAGNAADASVTRIRNSTQKKTFIGGISGKTVANGVGVIVNSNGQLGTIQSSARFKDDIKPMEKTSEALLKLKPVTFRYKEELDPEKIPQFGLIAEDVEKIDPDLVVKDEEGKVNTVRYEAVNAMLLNEFLKEHRKVEAQEATIAQLKKQVGELNAIVRQVKQDVTLLKPWPKFAANGQ